MIIVKVELHSAVTGRVQELARMAICNDATITHENPNKGNYDGFAYRGRDKETLDKRTISKTAKVTNWSRHQFHVWNLVSKMLLNMGYNQGH